jgi:3-dehydroquinate synthase
LSAKMGLVSQEEPSRVRAHLRAMGMKTDLKDIPGQLPTAEEILRLMGQDKKVIAGQLNFVLAREIGDAFVTDAVEPQDVLDVLKAQHAA